MKYNMMNFEVGRQYRVIKAGCSLDWMESTGPWCWQGRKHELKVGDVITYDGSRNGWGSDPIPEEKFKMGTVTGSFEPSNWGRVEVGWLEEVKETANAVG